MVGFAGSRVAVRDFRRAAVRVGYPVDVPRLLDVDGVPATPANRLDRGEGFRQGIEFAAGDAPIYVAGWRLRYALARTPTTIPTPPNPMLGGEGGERKGCFFRR